MRYPILTALVSVSMCTTISIAWGDASSARSQLRPLQIAELPVPCQQLGAVPPSSLIPDTDFAAHVSVANCLAEHAMGHLVLHPDSASITTLDAAAAPSIAILDDVIAHGDAHWKLVADSAKADLYVGIVVRMRSATNDPEDHTGIEKKLALWLDGAARATRDGAMQAGREHMDDDRGRKVATPVGLGMAPPKQHAEQQLVSALFDPAVVRTLRQEMRAEQRIADDRIRREQVRADVAADRRVLDIEEGRVVAFRAAWDRAVAEQHPNEAGNLAAEHQQAVLDEAAIRLALVRARGSVTTVRAELAVDRRRLQQLEARGDALVSRSLSRLRLDR